MLLPTRVVRSVTLYTLLALLAGAAGCASAVDAFDRGQHEAAEPILRGEHYIEDQGARITGTEPAYKQGGTFFVQPSSKDAFGTD